jgi:hypothetical protein
MAEEKQQQEGQKTIVAFVVGLLIGGMLVWAFSGSPSEAPKDDHDDHEETSTETTNQESNTTDGTSATTEAEAPKLSVGDGKIVVNDQPASSAIKLESATYPVGEGWVGVREFNNEQLGYILGVVRFSESQGLVPSEITLQRSTTAGRQYAVVVYTENGDFDFNLANDVQIDTVYSTFTAQ